ncbi:MAG: hypothetical protein IPH07_14260 [Deltaproteobacteria bacterium]|nr:hypothetical protein [Deltaproteobacteria bacterium]
MMNPRRIVSPLLGATLGVAFACTNSTIVRDPNHCFNADGDATCREKHGDDKPYCASGTCEPTVTDGCVPIRPDDDMCYAPCGGMKALADDPECDAVADDSSSSVGSSASASTTDSTGPSSSTSSMTGSTMSTTAGSSSTGPQGCAGDEACGEPGTPICIDEVCSPCESDAQCAAKDAGAPACRDDGQCVQCTASNDDGCGGATPICDAAVNTCMGCAFHEQCPDSACRIATGECFDEAAVVHVDADDGDSLSAEFVDGTVIILHNFGSTTAYQVNLALDTGVAAILAAPGDAPRIQGLGGAASISVENGGELYLANGVQVLLNGDSMFPGVAVDNASLYLDRARVVQNAGGGISLDNGAYALVRSSFVGGQTNNRIALAITNSDADVHYSTLASLATGAGRTVQCTSPGNVTIRNSLVVLDGTTNDEILCAGVVLDYNATETNHNGTNTPVGDFNTDWFSDANADFHLTPMAPAAILTAAQWQSGDPLIDIDGDARPGVDGSADVAGADIP